MKPLLVPLSGYYCCSFGKDLAHTGRGSSNGPTDVAAVSMSYHVSCGCGSLCTVVAGPVVGFDGAGYFFDSCFALSKVNADGVLAWKVRPSAANVDSYS